MKQLDLFYDAKLSKNVMNWPNDFDGAHQVGGVNRTPKIYESPDKGKTVYERDFGASTHTRNLIKSSVQQQWEIVHKENT